MKLKSLYSACLFTILVFITTCQFDASAIAGVSDSISFQGRLTDELGDPLPDGTHVLDFFFYDVPVGGKPLGAVLEVLVEIAGGDGVASTPIGPIDPSWFEGTPRYLGITVNDDDDDPKGDELQPRILLTAVPFALRALNLPETTVIVVQGGDFSGDINVGGNSTVGGVLTLNDPSGSNANMQIDLTGNYSIFRDDAGAGGNNTRLWFEAPDMGEIVLGPRGGNEFLGLMRLRSNFLRFDTSSGTTMVIDGPNVGIGTLSPLATFDVGNRILLANTDNPSIRFAPLAAAAFADIYMTTSDGSDTKILRIGGGGDVSSNRGGTIRFYGNEAPTDSLGSGGDIVLVAGLNGMVRTRAIQITGGGDLAEPFDVSSNDVDLQLGMVVVIDTENPGALKMSQSPYDRKVAGILSGANGINPGLILRQEGTIADGAHNVALTGRVWCWCDTSTGLIEPGDMLTTSSVLGHAMKVTEYENAHGAVIGKAMTPLDHGRGLVLVLVNLQ